MSAENPTKQEKSERHSLNGLSEDEIEKYISQHSDDSKRNLAHLSLMLHNDLPLLSPATRENICSVLYKGAKAELLNIEQEIKEQKSLGKNTVVLENQAREYRREIRYLAPHAGMPDREEWKDKDPFVFRESNVKELKNY